MLNDGTRVGQCVNFFTNIHYENLLMQYTEILFSRKNENFTGNHNIFNINAQYIECGFILEPLPRGSSNEYP